MKNPLTLEAFAEWLEKQPQDMRYDPLDHRVCLLARYYKACGFEDWENRSLNADAILNPGFASAAFGYVAECDASDWTVKDALSRARALIARDTSLGMRAEDVS